MNSSSATSASRYSIIFPANTLSGVEILKLIQHNNIKPLFTNIYLSFSGWDVAIDHATLEPLSAASAAQLEKSKPILPSAAAIKGADLAINELADTVIIAGLPIQHLRDRIERSNRQCLCLGKTLSALEELAELLGMPLNDWAMAIATYHREYIGGLTRLGIPYEPAPAQNTDESAPTQYTDEPSPSYSELINRELRIEGQIVGSESEPATYLSNFQLWGELKEQMALPNGESTVRKYDYADISFVLAPERFMPVLNSYLAQLQCNVVGDNEDSRYIEAQKKNSPMLLTSHILLFYNDERTKKKKSIDEINITDVVTVQFSSAQKFNQLIKEITSNHNVQALFNLAAEHGPHSVFLQAQCKRKHQVGEAVTQLVDDILAVTMVKSRPLREYRTTFFLPVEFQDQTVRVNPYIDLYKYDFKENHATKKNKSNTETDENKSNTEAKENKSNTETKENKSNTETKENKSNTEASASEKKHESLLNNIERINEKFDKSCYEYLDPSIRDLLISRLNTNNQLQPLKEWRLDLSTPGRGVSRYKGFKNWRIEAKFGKPQRNGYKSDKTPLVCHAVVRNLRLYQYFNGLYLLGITLQSVVAHNGKYLWFQAGSQDSDSNKNEDDKKILRLIENKSSIYNDDSDWWHDLIFGCSSQYRKIEQSQSAYWLILTQLFRSILPSFEINKGEEWHKDKEGVEFSIFHIAEGQDFLKLSNYCKVIPEYKRKNIFPLVEFFLNQFFEEKYHKAELYPWHDDRMYVNTAYSMAGVIADSDIKRESFLKLFSYILYVDSGGFEGMDDWAYDPVFLQTLMDEHTNRRWFMNGVLAGFTDYSTAHAGFGYYFHTDAINHAHHQYEKMLILALFYQSSLRHYSRRLQLASNELVGSGSGGSFRKMREDFIWFTNVYWFHELTEQIQGKEIFAKQLAGLGLQKDYDLIKTEVDWADEFLEMKQQRWFNIVAGCIAFIAFPLEIIQLVVSPEKIKFKEGSLQQEALNYFGGEDTILTTIFITLFSSIIALSLYYVVNKFFPNFFRPFKNIKRIISNSLSRRRLTRR